MSTKINCISVYPTSYILEYYFEILKCMPNTMIIKTCDLVNLQNTNICNVFIFSFQDYQAEHQGCHRTSCVPNFYSRSDSHGH